MGTDTQVGIIGGGPAGASMGAYLAKNGVRCVVLEAERFPRPHVGESLVPSAMRVFRDLEFLGVMEAARFPRKYGAGWTAPSTTTTYSVDFSGIDDGVPQPHADGPNLTFAERAQPGVEQHYTYHVDRGKFDQLLLQHAAKLGADVREGVKVTNVELDPAGGPARIHHAGGSTTCEIVVDASGRRTLLGNQLKLRVRDEVFDQYAVHTWFEGYDRRAAVARPEMADFIFIHFLPEANTWLWQIPISETVTSIGVVTQRKSFGKTAEAREALFWSTLKSRPEVYERLRAAERIRPFTDEGDYSYAMKEITGDRWCMVGDAGRFVDPIFSTGVSIALNSSRFAHADILRALETGRFGKDAFSGYASTIRRGTKNWYEFIRLYYRLNVLFTFFVTDKRYRLDVLKLLQGDVYDEDEPRVLAEMRKRVAKVEQDPKHPWHPLLNDLTANAFRPAF